MDRKQEFIESIKSGYTFLGDFITLGASMLDGECMTGNFVCAPLKTINRHGLIAGATGTGKTKTLQLMAEELSLKGIPVMLMDLKGDLGGIAESGVLTPEINARNLKMGINNLPMGFGCEFLTISNEKGVRLRATVSEFGPVLLSKILSLNETQAGIMTVIFKYSDDNKLPLLDIKDLKKILQFAVNEGKNEIDQNYGKIPQTSVGTIIRKILEIEQLGGELFFGEKSFEVQDLLRFDNNGRGIISIFRIKDIQDKPNLFSAFMLCLLAEIYSSFPEAGDLAKPKLVLFIDEAHLLFENASKALLSQIETIIKLIRSKGVGIFFCTQNPTDIPESILSQLGMKVQHALRAFTPKDRDAIKAIASNYPFSQFYKTDELLTSLGIGEAAITILNENGVPTPLVAALIQAPRSRMGILNENEVEEVVNNSTITSKYNKLTDSVSAYEMLNEKIRLIAKLEQNELEKRKNNTSDVREKKLNEPDIFNNPIVKQIGRTVGNTVAREITRGVLGVFGLGGRHRR